MIDLPWAQFGVAVTMLTVFIGLHFRSIKSGEKRESQMRGDLGAHRKECRDDADKLVVRIQNLEDRQYKDAIGMAKTCAEALKMNAETARRQIEIGVETSRHAALTKGKP